MSWENVKLESVVTILSGFAFKSKLFNEAKTGLPIIRIRDVTRGFSETYYDGPFDEKYLIQDGDFLIGMDGEFNIAPWKGGSALLNQRVCKIDHVDERTLDRRYLAHFLVRELKKIEDLTPYVTVKHLSVKTLNTIEIPLPPLAEQQRIAAILDKADALRSQRRAALAKLDTLLQATFLHLFGDPNSVFPKIKVESLVKEGKGKIRTGPFGSQLLHSEFIDDPNGVMVLGIDNAVQNQFVYTNNRYISHEKYEQLQRYTVNPDDVLITIMGTCGRCSIVPKDIPLAINTKHLCCITLNQKKCLPVYLKYAFLLHPFVLKQLGISERGAVMPGLNMGIIKNLSIPLPPIELQGKFVAFVAKHRNQNKTFSKSHEELDNLFHALQQRAFHGQLPSSPPPSLL